MSEQDRRKFRIRFRPADLNDPQWIQQSIPDLLEQAMQHGEATATPRPDADETTAEPGPEAEYGTAVDEFSNQVTDELIAAAPEIIGAARQQREELDEAARIQRLAEARVRVLQIAERLKGIGLSAEVVDEDVSVRELRR